MGREATCLCQLGGTTAHIKALLEPPDLILRGEIRQRIPIIQISNLKVEDDRLSFTHNDSEISLTLGPEQARKWETALRKPPPDLTPYAKAQESAEALLTAMVHQSMRDRHRA